MKSKVVIDAGICGFKTTVSADCQDGQNVEFVFETGCDKIKRYSQTLLETGLFDAYSALIPGPCPIFTIAGQTQGCCTSCIVPAGVFKAMQVAAGLALPKNTSMEVSVVQ